METDLIETLTKYRMAVGYLGEKTQYGWWQSSFFTQGSQAFLSPLFGRTQTLAQCNGVTRAAALVHDERIGIGHVYHLFRLPEDIEQAIHRVLYDLSSFQKLQEIIETPEKAMNFLYKQTENKTQIGVGPIKVGIVEELHHIQTWQTVAGMYHYAFTNGEAAFPYFAG